MTETEALPLVLTKLRVPAGRLRCISRTHLLDLLSHENEASLTLVCAPAGYGKTTLLKEWAQSLGQSDSAVAWYALDASDDDPIPFNTYLIASFIQALGPVSELTQIAHILRTSPEIDQQRILSTLINAVSASGRNCVLILDDYHLIGSPVIHSAIAYLLEHLPENLRIALGSRADPPLPLARLRARRQILEIRAAGLRFTSAETMHFLNGVMRLELPSEMVAALEERTEGWAAGLQLAALSLGGRSDKESLLSSFTGSHRYLVEYLLDEVFNRQSKAIQSFLLSTSILERMCAGLCDTILEQSIDSAAILKQLEHSSLFLVALDDEGVWYRYHHLFRDFLQNRLRQTQTERIPLLHRAAGEWYALHGALREAALHTFQTGDWDYAAAFVEQHSFSLIVHSEITMLHEWCSAFPEKIIREQPALGILQCWPWVLRYQHQNRGKIEARLQQVEQTIAALEDRQRASELSEHAAIIRTFLAMAPDPAADPRELIALAQSSLGCYPDGDPGQFSALLTIGYAYMALHNAPAAVKSLEAARQAALRGGLYFGIVESSFHLARLAHGQGQLQRAAQICRQSREEFAALLVNPDQELPAVGSLDIALGGVLLEQDHLEDAERHLLQGLSQVGWSMNPFCPMIACVQLFRLCEIEGRSAEALAFLSRLETAWPEVSFCTQGLRVVHTLRAAPAEPGALADAAAWCQNFSASLGNGIPSSGMGPYGATEVYYLASLSWVYAQIAIGNPRSTLPYLEQQLALANTYGLTSRVIELTLLEALAADAEGDHDRALAAIERALLSAQPAGYLRIFDQGPILNRLLVKAAGRGICRPYVEQILSKLRLPRFSSAFRPDETALPGPAAQSPQGLEYGASLSERELEVLRLIAQGATNQAIAAQLVITVGTVKSHINHILRKLDAHNRTSAVARARGLGLLDL